MVDQQRACPRSALSRRPVRGRRRRSERLNDVRNRLWFLAGAARRHGFTANGGPRVHVVGTVYAGTVAEHCNEYDKRDRALQLAARREVPIDRCCAIGDSRSDIPLFDALPTSLALNAGSMARAAASAAVDTQDLRDVVPWLETWKHTLR